MQDGNRGAGALSPDQSVEAMLAAVQSKQNDGAAAGSESAKVPEPEAPNVEEAPKVEDAPAEKVEGSEQAPAGDEYEFNFDEDGFTGARDLAAKLDANEALKAALPDDLRNELMANARLAEALAPFREIFGSPAEAKVVAQAAQEFAGIQQIFTSIQGEGIQKGTSDLLNKMLEMSALRDENGNPRRRANGTYITDGTTTNFLNELFERKFNNAIVKKIQDSGDDAAIAALDLVMERAGLRPSTADKDKVDDPALAARKAELDRQQAEINRQQQAARTERETTFRNNLDNALQTTTNGAIDSVLKGATGLTEFTKGAVTAKLTRAIKEAIKNNTAYWMEKDRLAQQPMSQERHNAEVKLARDFLHANLARIARPILAEAGIAISKKAAERAAAQTARAEAARGEVQGAAPGQQANRPADASNPSAAREQTRARLREQLGREPNQSEINIEMMLNLPGLKR